MDTIINRITNYIVKDTDLDYEVINYGVSAIVSTVLCYSMALLATGILGNLWFGLLFICFLTPIKMQFLGYHCKTMGQCICTYSICVGFCLIIYNLLPFSLGSLYLILFCLTMILIVILVKKEINHKNRMILLIYFLLGSVLFYLNIAIFIILYIAVSFDFVLLLLKHLKDFK